MPPDETITTETQTTLTTETTPTQTASEASGQQSATTTATEAGKDTKPEGESLLGKPEDTPFDPEKLVLPEGFTKDETFNQSLEVLKALPQGEAQKLVDLHAQAVKQIAQQQMDAWVATNDKWQEEIKADEELGGNNLPKVLQTVSKVLDNPEFADPGIREALNMTGAGNNPAIVRTIYRMALKLSEGTGVQGEPATRNGQGQLANQPATVADALYGPGGPHTGGPKLG